jgi:hypothetical protein
MPKLFKLFHVKRPGHFGKGSRWGEGMGAVKTGRKKALPVFFKWFERVPVGN